MAEENLPEKKNSLGAEKEPVRSTQKIKHLPSEVFTGELIGVVMPDNSRQPALVISLSGENKKTLEDFIATKRNLELFSLSDDFLKYVGYSPEKGKDTTKPVMPEAPKGSDEGEGSALGNQVRRPTREEVNKFYEPYDKVFPSCG